MAARVSQSEVVAVSRSTREVVEPLAVPAAGLGFAVGMWSLVGLPATHELVSLPTVDVDRSEVSGG